MPILLLLSNTSSIMESISYIFEMINFVLWWFFSLLQFSRYWRIIFRFSGIKLNVDHLLHGFTLVLIILFNIFSFWILLLYILLIILQISVCRQSVRLNREFPSISVNNNIYTYSRTSHMRPPVVCYHLSYATTCY